MRLCMGTRPRHKLPRCGRGFSRGLQYTESAQWARARRLRALQYMGLRMPWYPGTVACDECPNPSRNLVQACLWGRGPSGPLFPHHERPTPCT